MTPNVLAEIVERAGKATGADRALDLALATALVPDVVVLRRNDDDTANEPYTYWEYTGSVDAALGLVERLLPGTRPRLDFDERPRCYLHRSTGFTIGSTQTGWFGYADAETMPLAILFALLTALKSLSETTNVLEGDGEK